MSLRTKTHLLLLAFVVVPIVVVGVTFSVPAESVLKRAARGSLDASAHAVSAEIEARLASARSRFREFAEEIGRDSRAAGDDRHRELEEVLREALSDDSVLAGALSSLRVTTDGWTSTTSLDVPIRPVEYAPVCASDGAVPAVKLRAGVDLADGRQLLMVGTVPSTALMSGQQGLGEPSTDGITVIADRRSGRTMQVAPCDDTLRLPREATGTHGYLEKKVADPGVARAGAPQDTRLLFVEGEESMLSMVRLNDPAWTIGRAASVRTILAPAWRLRLTFVIFAVLVGAAALLTFSFASRGFFRSLEELHRAVERIGRGDFDFWLPPPGKDEVGWLSRALGRMSERITHMVRGAEKRGSLALVGEMAAHVAHEIRTPLSSIKMTLQRLQRDAGAGRDDEEDARSAKFESCLREIERLEKTVLSVLDLGAERQLSPRDCSLHALIGEMVSLVEGVIDHAGVSVQLDLRAESDRVCVDPGRIKGVFLNLLMNALDATSAGGRISIRTHLLLDGQGRQMLAATVRDTGRGVPEHLRSRIFDPFFTTKEEGGGMGLSFALKTMQEHGGDLFLLEPSDEGEGASFVVVLPLLVDRGGGREVSGKPTEREKETFPSSAEAARPSGVSVRRWRSPSSWPSRRKGWIVGSRDDSHQADGPFEPSGEDDR